MDRLFNNLPIWQVSAERILPNPPAIILDPGPPAIILDPGLAGYMAIFASSSSQ